jgi:hypothetical protein
VNEDKRFVRRRRILLGTVVISVVALFARLALETGSVLVGAAGIAGVGALGWWFLGRERAKTESALREPPGGVLTVNAALDFDSLPEEWRDAAREASSALAPERMPALNVVVRADGGWLTVEKRRMFGAGKTPFGLRIPLAAVTDVETARPKVGLVGSSLTFRFSQIDDLVFDVVAGRELTAAVASRFKDAADAARWGAHPGPLVMEVTTAPPPAKTPPGRGAVMFAACFIPFALAMVGAEQGPFAALVATAVMVIATVLSLLRPPGMGRVLGAGMWVTAAAFAVDTVATGQPLRLGGTACAVALARWMAGRSTPEPDGS